MSERNAIITNLLLLTKQDLHSYQVRDTILCFDLFFVPESIAKIINCGFTTS